MVKRGIVKIHSTNLKLPKLANPNILENYKKIPKTIKMPAEHLAEYSNKLEEGGYHYRITPFKWENEKKKDVLLYDIDFKLREIATLMDPILYCIENADDKLTLHYHILMSNEQQAQDFKAYIKDQGAKGNKCSSLTQIRDGYKVVKYVLKDGEYHSICMLDNMRFALKKLCETTFKRDNFKEKIFKLEDDAIMGFISLDKFHQTYVDMCIDYNFRNRLQKHQMGSYFRFIQLKMEKQRSAEEGAEYNSFRQYLIDDALGLLNKW